MAKYSWQSINDFLHSQEWEIFDASRRGNDLYLSNPDRAERCYNASEQGSDGSTHSEIIEDWRAFLNSLKTFDPDFDDIEDEPDCDITQSQYDKIMAEIDDCEQWHVDNGSINQQLS